jgi:nicotinamidase/pyrazinamidase
MMRIDPAGDALIVVDVQPDFMPGGALPVPGGDLVLSPINRLLERPFAAMVATQDWHPPDHVSFASQHPGRAPFDSIVLAYGPQTLWPDHCVQGSPGAALHQDLLASRIELIVRKGFRRGIDSYSAFRENDRATATGLNGYLGERGVRRVFLCGLATDFCVLASALDAAELGYAVVVIEDACRAIAAPLEGGRTTLSDARARLSAVHIELATADALE